MLETDIVIVGTGPAGAAAAHGLVEKGARVLVIEAGARPENDRFAKMERSLTNTDPWPFSPYPYQMVGDDIELNEFAIRRLGGSSLAWGAITPRYQPGDFNLKSRFGIGMDWPLTYEELERFYCAAERFMGVSGADDNPWTPPRSEPYPMGPFPMNDSDVLIKERCRLLGIKMHSVPVARNVEPYDGRSACLYYSTCRACPIAAMYGSDRTIERLERNANLEVLTEAEVVRVEVDANHRVSRVIYCDSKQREHAVKCRTVILAVQAVETVRILLNSKSGIFPSGLANNNGLLGMYLMEHPKFYMRGRVKERLHPFRQGFETATTFQFHDHPHRGDYAGGRLLVRECAGPSVSDVAVKSGNWGKQLQKEIRETFGHYVTLGAFLEQLPYGENRVSLSNKVKMQNRDAAAKVNFRLVHAYEKQGFLEMKKVMERIFDAIGAEDVSVIMDPSNSGHYMGGHVMGKHPDTSVTNSFLETHEVKNLYLASGGVFPTAGVSNPTLTTVALVFRMVDHLLNS